MIHIKNALIKVPHIYKGFSLDNLSKFRYGASFRYFGIDLIEEGFKPDEKNEYYKAYDYVKPLITCKNKDYEYLSNSLRIAEARNINPDFLLINSVVDLKLETKNKDYKGRKYGFLTIKEIILNSKDIFDYVQNFVYNDNINQI